MAAATMAGCNYLDIVPDNTVELSNLFETKEKAYNALADCYSYMPDIEGVHQSMALAGDEWIGRLDAGVAGVRSYTRGSKLMRDWNNSTDPILGFWSGAGGAKDLYEGIRICNIFLNGLGDIPNMQEEERIDWMSQVKVLKAYYHFYLLRLYGPIIIADKNYEPYEIIIADKNYEPYDDIDLIRQERKPVEECFQYILGLIDDVLYDENGNEKEDLYNSRSEIYLGQIDRVVAKALKAKILLYRASPFFNGNSEFYSNFKNAAGEPYFPQTYDKEKWKEALDATEIAIEAAEAQGKKLYEFSGQVKFWDQDDWEKSEIMKYCYNNRFSINDPWNSEVVWGYSNIYYTSSSSIAAASNLRGDPDDPNNASFSFQWLGAWVAVDRCIWRDYDTRVYPMMRYGEWPGGRNSGNATDYYWTGIAVKKYVHPESRGAAWQRVVNFPYPLIRMADLYLMYAECYNEYYGPGQPAYDKINAVRARAGLLRPIEELWNDASIVKTVGKHLTQDGLRDIIHTERMIELSFEGQSFYDICRWKRGDEFFNKSVQGWNAPDGATAESFYQLTTWQPRTWITPKSYLMPIPSDEINKNPKVDQNPGY